MSTFIKQPDFSTEGEQVYSTLAGDRLDQICFKYYGFVHGSTEAVLAANSNLSAYANTNPTGSLADLGTIYPAGIVIKLPDLIEEKISNHKMELWS